MQPVNGKKEWSQENKTHRKGDNADSKLTEQIQQYIKHGW